MTSLYYIAIIPRDFGIYAYVYIESCRHSIINRLVECRFREAELPALVE